MYTIIYSVYGNCTWPRQKKVSELLTREQVGQPFIKSGTIKLTFLNPKQQSLCQCQITQAKKVCLLNVNKPLYLK